MRFAVFLAIALPSLAPMAAQAGLCDYRLSQVIERRQSPAGDAARAANAAPSDPGPMLYLMVNPRTGATSVGATGGAQAQPDSGVLVRTARLLGAAVAMVGAESPLLGISSTAIGVGLEAVCRLQDERINGYDDVLGVLREVDANMPPDLFALIEPGLERRDAFIRFSRNDGYEMSEYPVKDLYIVNGRLYLRNWGVNEIVGDIAVFMPRAAE
ncbi:hypothetical protein [Pararhodobacter zhoushanensis]|uniref:Uncharacterized protein n=1 Tax=Pararhodobacter zhoushanensis TaxID=2479545 RepID=A0ABT3H4S4_9RHOB|nr:hypothetical protein [Pararhodobacter zhoushanensis]MCW1934779.1 hypothetical protein [Pararhodobacter zhoushanensis]